MNFRNKIKKQKRIQEKATKNKRLRPKDPKKRQHKDRWDWKGNPS